MLQAQEFENQFITMEDSSEVGGFAANAIAECVFRKPTAVLGLATGSTPEPMYAALVKMKNNGLDLSQITTFNLDEYVGLSPRHNQSYHHYMRTKFFDLVGMRKDRAFIPNGMAPDLSQECNRYEELIVQCGGIDLQILGVGTNGHIGFCEPGTDFRSRVHVALLSEATRKANARFFANICDVPTRAITMGLATIMEACHILLMAHGVNKSLPFSALLKSPVTDEIPVTILRLHPKVQVVVDKAAWSGSKGLALNDIQPRP